MPGNYVTRNLLAPGPSIPTAEKSDLKSEQCGFESHLGHMMIVIKLQHATFGLIVDRNTKRITEAPPIAHWTIGKSAKDVWDYYKKKTPYLLLVE